MSVMCVVVFGQLFGKPILNVWKPRRHDDEDYLNTNNKM